MMNLNGDRRRRLHQAIISAYPSISNLKMMVDDELGYNLDAIAGGNNLQEVVFNLINTCVAQGWLEDLIRAAIKANPRNPDLQAIAEELLSNSPQQLKILILAAIPDRLRLDKEIQKIRSAIERAKNRDIFKIENRTAVSFTDIRRAIADEKPQIVHFCGHGEQDGSLRLEDDAGKEDTVAPEILASLFKLHADYVKCVLLNACYSEKSAEAISKYINYAIGMNNPIQDSTGIKFAEAFYDGLGYISNNQDVFKRAFDEGMLVILKENPSPDSKPVLKKNVVI